MQNKRIFALLTALLMVFTLCVGALAEEPDLGDPQRSPELWFRAYPEAGQEWSGAFAKGGVAEFITQYRTAEEYAELDPWNTYDAEGGMFWMRVDGVAEGVDTLTLTCGGEDAPIKALNLVIHVDAKMNATILGIGTDGAIPQETAPEGAIHPVLMLADNPDTGESWTPSNSIVEGVVVESKYVEGEGGGAEHVALSGMGEGAANTLINYARGGEKPLFFIMNLWCDADTNVEIAEILLTW